jgi:hypothetical protein
MDKIRLFEYLEEKDSSVLLNILKAAYDEMTINQRRVVFGIFVEEIPPASIDGEILLEEITIFHTESLDGVYYAPFDINSKNFMDIPEETEEWFEKLGDFLESSSQLTIQGHHSLAIQCFELLYELIDEMESGEEIVFADELGGWMIPGDEKKFITAYLTSLSAITTPEEFTEKALPLIRQDSYESFANKVYTTAINIAKEKQKAYLKAEIKRQNIKTRPR